MTSRYDGRFVTVNSSVTSAGSAPSLGRTAGLVARQVVVQRNAPPLQVVQAQPVRDAGDPGAQRRFVGELVQLLVHADEDVLAHLLAVARVTRDLPS